MHPQDYCAHKVLAPGNSLYYSLYFVPTVQRDALVVLHALLKEWYDIVYECHDDQVALRKFAWWQGELEQVYQQQAKHPAAQALQGLLAQHALAIEDWQTILNALQDDVYVTRYPDADQLQTHAQRIGGTFAKLCCQVIDSNTVMPLASVQQCGTGLYLLTKLRHVRADVLRGRLYLPQTALTELGIRHQTLFDLSNDAPVPALFACQAQQIRTLYQTAWATLPSDVRYAQRGLWLKARLAMLWLETLEEDGYQLFRHQLLLPPLRKLSVAWRTYWRWRLGW